MVRLIERGAGLDFEGFGIELFSGFGDDADFKRLIREEARPLAKSQGIGPMSAGLTLLVLWSPTR